MVADALLAGPQAVRVRGERVALGCCILAAPTTLALASLVLPTLSFSQFLLLAVGGMLFVSIGRGRLLGSSVRIEGRQLPELAEIVRDVAARLDVAVPQIFVRDDPFVAIAAVGIGDPYALVVSSQYYEHLRRGELRFLIARELGHIAAGHTRIASLLSASGRENPVVAFVFGAWLRRAEYTADRIGLLCCDGLADAMGAIAITTFHAIGRRVDMHVLAEQRRDFETEPALRIGEWIAAVPYATNRIDALRAFGATPACDAWRERLAAAPEATPAPAAAVGAPVSRRDLAPLVRRLGAIAVDLVVIGAIAKLPLVVEVTRTTDALHDAGLPAFLMPLARHVAIVDVGAHGIAVFAIFFAYSALFVALAGQTPGMMVVELRVVTTRYERPTLVQSFWRYAAALGTVLSAVALVGLFARVHPHERLSRTRLVRGRRPA